MQFVCMQGARGDHMRLNKRSDYINFADFAGHKKGARKGQNGEIMTMSYDI